MVRISSIESSGGNLNRNLRMKGSNMNVTFVVKGNCYSKVLSVMFGKVELGSISRLTNGKWIVWDNSINTYIDDPVEDDILYHDTFHEAYVTLIRVWKDMMFAAQFDKVAEKSVDELFNESIVKES
jgi:hypothetical protein